MATSMKVVPIAPTDDALDLHSFKIMPAAALPVVDLTRTVKTALMSPKVRRRWNWFVRRFHLLCITLYAAGIIMCGATWYIPVQYGRITALACVMCGAFGSAIAVLGLRIEMLGLLAKSFDVWFFTVTNTINSVVMILYLGDSRGMIVPMLWLGFETNVLIDANLSCLEGFFLSGALAVLFVNGVAVACLTLKLVSASHSFAVLRYLRRSLHSEDVMAHNFMTMGVLVLRNVYRRRAIVRKHKDAMFHCIGLRCSVRYMPHFFQAQNRLSSSKRLASRTFGGQRVRMTRANLEYSDLGLVVSSSSTVWPTILPSISTLSTQGAQTLYYGHTLSYCQIV